MADHECIREMTARSIVLRVAAKGVQRGSRDGMEQAGWASTDRLLAKCQPESSRQQPPRHRAAPAAKKHGQPAILEVATWAGGDHQLKIAAQHPACSFGALLEVGCRHAIH